MHGGDDESSSSAEDSGPEVDYESEAESTSSSSGCSRILEAETENRSSPTGDESGGKDDGREETEEMLERVADESRSPPADLLSVPSYFDPHLTPQSLQPRRETVVSTLNLQVLPQENTRDAFCIIEQHKVKPEESVGGNQLQPPQTWWPQHQLSYQYQQQQEAHQLFQHHRPPLSVQGQPAMLVPPVLHAMAAHAHLHTPHAAAQQCWCCSTMFPHPYFPQQNNYSGARLPR